MEITQEAKNKLKIAHGKAIRIENDRKNEQNRKMENSVGFKELGILTKKYVQNSKTVRQ